MRDEITQRIDRAVDENIFPACVVGVVRANGDRLVIPRGRFTFDSDAQEVRKDSIFDVASITKSIPVSCLALKLVEEEKLGLDDRLIKYVPEFRNAQRELVTIKHLLTMTLWFDSPVGLATYKDRSPKEIFDYIFSLGFGYAPGERFAYTNITSILLGLVIERVAGKPLHILADEHFFQPLEMSRTMFRPLQKFSKEEIVPTEIDDWRGGLVQGVVHDESAYALDKEKVVGSAGLFSTVPDLLTFLEMLLCEGVHGNRRYFSGKMVKQMQTNQLVDIGERAGLGWEMNLSHSMGKYASEQAFGKTGFTGTSCVIDIPRGIGIVILSNFVYPRRKDKSLIRGFRSDIADIVFKSLGEAQ